MYDKEKFGQRISKLRKERWEQYRSFQNSYSNPFKKFRCCKNQNLFAEQIGVERRTFGKWESGNATPSFEQVLKICELLECDIEHLLGKEDLTGFPPAVLASHYSRINIDIIEYAQRDDDYLDFLNHFMHPTKCLPLIKAVTSAGWKEFWSNTELDELSEPLSTMIIDVFQTYQTFTPFNLYNKVSYAEAVFSEFPKDKFSFSSQKRNDKINVCSCLSAQRFKELNLSGENKESYTIFMDYLIEYSFNILNKKSLVDVQKNNLGKTFVELFEKHLSD